MEGTNWELCVYVPLIGASAIVSPLSAETLATPSTSFSLHSALLSSVGFALLFTVMLNIPSFLERIRGEEKIVLMNSSVDELFYFSHMRQTAETGRVVGNVVLDEYRDLSDHNRSGVIFQGFLMRAFHWQLGTTVLFGDILFPFLIVFFFTLALRPIFGTRAGIVSFVACSVIGVTLLRSVSPQVTYTFVALHLWLFIAYPERRSTLIVRGLIIFLLLFIHVVTVPFLLAAEGLYALLHWYQTKDHRGFVQHVLSIGVPTIAALVGKFLLNSGMDPVMVLDHLRRDGMIPSHLPAAPITQIKIILTMFVLWWISRRTHAQKESKIILLLLGALLVVLNQSVIHGIDVVFGLYYSFPAKFVLAVSWMFLFWRALPLRFSRIIFASFFLFGIAVLSRQIFEFSSAQTSLVKSHDPALIRVIETLQELPEKRIILAPTELSNRIPAFTPHSTLFNAYAFYGFVSDAELVERYLLQEAIFPTPSDQVDRTYGFVFGIYAGNVAARNRTLSNPSCLLWRDQTFCDADVRSEIFHQELVPLLDNPSVDAQDLLQKFHVNTIVTDRRLLPEIERGCTIAKTVDEYRILDCDF